MKKAAKSEKKRRGKIIPAVGVGLMTLTSTACASMRAADANTEVRSTNVLMAEEEVSDVSLATFHVFDKEGPVRLAAGHGCGGGCGHGGGCGSWRWLRSWRWLWSWRRLSCRCLWPRRLWSWWLSRLSLCRWLRLRRLRWLRWLLSRMGWPNLHPIKNC